MPDNQQPSLRALFLNCTLKRSPRESHSDAMIEMCRRLMEPNGVIFEALRPVDLTIAPGMNPDMTDHGWERDDWPGLYAKVREANILVLCTPIWLGDKSSVCTKIIERLYSQTNEQNEKGQGPYHGKVCGCLVTGNEDGVKASARDTLFTLNAMGFTIPPRSYTGWIGPVGPGPSYRDDESGGPENSFANKTTAMMCWNLIHMARILRAHGGIPRQGTSDADWDAGNDRFGLPPVEEIRNLRNGPSHHEAARD